MNQPTWVMAFVFMAFCFINSDAFRIEKCANSMNIVPRDSVAKLAEADTLLQKGRFHPITIPVIWHYVKQKPSKKVEDNIPTQKTLEYNIKALNYFYSVKYRTGFRFMMKGKLKVHNEPKSTLCSNTDDDPKSPDSQIYLSRKYAQSDNSRVLEIFLCPRFSSEDESKVGNANFPQEYLKGDPSTSTVFFDISQIIPTNVKYNGRTTIKGFDPTTDGTGTTLLHEVGHWLGLLHVFQNECKCCEDRGPDDDPDTDSEPTKPDEYERICRNYAPERCFKDVVGAQCGHFCGDQVADTPPCKQPQDWFEEQERDDFDETCSYDTCKVDNQKDMAHNIMNYASENCQFNVTKGYIAQLTQGQIARMRRMMLAYRRDFFKLQ